MVIILLLQTLCEYPVAEHNKEKIHPPRPIRVNVALSNLMEFAETFNCPLDSPMNPKNKCNMWEKPQSMSRHLLNNLF